MVREGADVVDLTEILRFHGHLTGWPEQMRVIERRQRPHPGAQLRFNNVDGYRLPATGYRLTAFATNAARGQLADLELRHRRRARCEDRIRIAKDTSLTRACDQGAMSTKRAFTRYGAYRSGDFSRSVCARG